MSALRPIFAAAACILFVIVSGPISWAQMPEWSRIGPWGGEITALGYADSVVFAGTDGGGVYRSTDYGTTWNYIQSSVLGDHAGGFAVRGATIIKYSGYGGPCRSSDRGETWQMLSSVDYPTLMDFLGDTLIVITQQGEVHGSTDYGDSWTPRGVVPGRGINCMEVYDNEMLVGTNWGLFYSNDGGRFWEELQVHPSDSCIMALHITAGTILAAGAHYEYTPEHQIYYSTNRGVSWLQSQGVTPRRIHGFVETHGQIMAATGLYGDGEILSSTDGGASWLRRDNRTNSGEVRALLAVGDTILAGEGLQWRRGISRSFDGGANWHYSNTGLSGLGVADIIFHGNTLLATGQSDSDDDGVYRSTDGGGNWTRADLGPQYATMRGIISCGDVLLCGLGHLRASGGGGIYRSTDEGQTWAKVTTETAFVLEFIRSGSTIAALVQLQIRDLNPSAYISTDCGATWNASPFAFKDPVEHHILLHGSTLFVFAGSKIFRSDDLGLNWTRGGDLRKPVTARATIGETIVLGLEDGSITRSTDNGNTWIDARDRLSSRYIAYLASWQGDLYAATPFAIYRSSDGGDNWSEFSPNPGGRFITAFAVHNSMLYVGTGESGVFVTTAPSSVTMEDNQATWFMVAPNPTSGETSLRYLLRTPGNVEVEIFNGIGERVMTYQENMPSGEHMLRLDFSGQAAGYYLLRIQTPEGIAVQKMLVGMP